MRWKKKWKTVFYKLIISYMILILMTTAFVGIASYYYFSLNFNQQVEKVNHRLLTYLGHRIESQVIGKAEETYREITFDNPVNSASRYLFNHSIEGNHAVISEAYYQLKDIVAVNQELFHSVQIYYARNNVVLSSLSGISYLDENVAIDLEWLKRARESKQGTLWLETRKVSSNPYSDSYVSDVLTFVKPYPYTTKKENIQGYIAININEETLRQMLVPTDPGDHSEFLLLNGNGQLLTHSDPAALYNESVVQESFIGRVSRLSGLTGNDIETINGIKTMVSYISIRDMDWKLVNTTPVNEYYKSIVPIRNSLILVCILAVVMGLIVSNVLTNNFYNPLRPILRMANTMLGNKTQPETPVNEFKIINHVIENLSDKVTTLESTLHANMPFIKHNLVTGLMHNTIVTEDELRDRLKLLQLDLSGKQYVLTFHLDEQRLNELPIENRQFIKYSLIDHIESQTASGRTLLAIELSEHDICAIVCTDAEEMSSAVKLAEQIDGYVHMHFQIPMTTIIGQIVDSPLQLHISFRSTQTLLQHRFFMSEQIIYGDHIALREHNDEKVPSEVITGFAAALRTQDKEQISEEWMSLRQLFAHGSFSAEHCHQACKDLVACLRQYMEEIHLPVDAALRPELTEYTRRIRHISEFETLLLQSAHAAIEWIGQRSTNRNNELIQRVKAYIIDNLAAPLSLESIADHVRISPSYLSKLFKEGVGSNITDFITKSRIQQSCELLLTTDLTIEQIATKVGFNSSAYYIRKFKELYGITPKAYQRNYEMKIQSAVSKM